MNQRGEYRGKITRNVFAEYILGENVSYFVNLKCPQAMDGLSDKGCNHKKINMVLMSVILQKYRE